MYTGATGHLTRELDKMHMREAYQGKEHVYTTNGSGMGIYHVGQALVPTRSFRPLYLSNVLHVPDVTKSLLFVHRLSSNNDVFFWVPP
jgi:hypothetical protein